MTMTFLNFTAHCVVEETAFGEEACVAKRENGVNMYRQSVDFIKITLIYEI